VTAYWIGVASRDHVRAAVAGGFAQLGHGKRTVLDRMVPGDRLIYYSPRERLGGGEAVRAFTAIGEVLDAPVVRGEMAGDFHAFRRDVQYFAADDAPIAPLLPLLSFTRKRTTWGVVFRRGAFRVDRDDYERIATAMRTKEPKPLA
jgi:EVE domain-containing protein